MFDQLQIRAFEYPQGYLFESIISDENIDADYQIKYKNNYCISGFNTIKIIENFVLVDKGYTLKNEGNFNLGYTIAGPNSSFKYWLVTNGNIATK